MLKIRQTSLKSVSRLTRTTNNKLLFKDQFMSVLKYLGIILKQQRKSSLLHLVQITKAFNCSELFFYEKPFLFQSSFSQWSVEQKTMQVAVKSRKAKNLALKKSSRGCRTGIFFIRPTEIEAVEFEAEAEVRYHGLRKRSDQLNTQAFVALQKC